MRKENNYKAGLYCRLSKDDDRPGESASIETQRQILTEYCRDHGIEARKVYVDDGYSGLNFERPAFRELLVDIDQGLVNMVITKDLSRLGRDYIMTGYYSEIFFPSKGVRYIAVADDFDSLRRDNDIAPFKNILNDMYARDISRKVRNAKRSRARQGRFIGSQAPYGYKADNGKLIIDCEAAGVVREIYALAASGRGEVAIANELSARCIVTPSVYKYRNGDMRFSRYPSVKNDKPYDWCAATIRSILTDRVYLGELTSLKTEVTNCKTKQRVTVPENRRVVTKAAHEAIIDDTLFDRVQQIRRSHRCPAFTKRENIFRNLLFCEYCGHPLVISRKQLKYREADIYLCMNHYRKPEDCPKTHRIYHEMLYSYVLEQIQSFAKSMRRRKINSAIADYAVISELTPAILNDVIERIEIGHVGYRSKPRKVIRIYWKLK